MKLLLSIILLFAGYSTAFAQIQWENTYSTGFGMSVVQSPDSGFVFLAVNHIIKTNILGDSIWRSNLPPASTYDISNTSDNGFIIAGESNTQPNFGFVLIKTDSVGSVQWEKTYGDSLWESIGRAVIETFDGGFAALGTGYRLIGFVTPDRDLHLVRTDKNGDTLWSRAYGGRKIIGGPDSLEWGYDLKQTSDGGFILLGSTRMGIYLVKTDSSGNKLWDIFSFDISSPRGIQITPDAGFIICGFRSILKLDSMGGFQWSKIYKSMGQMNDIAITNNGSFGICGTYKDNSNFSRISILITDQNGDSITSYMLGAWPNGENRGHGISSTYDGGLIASGAWKDLTTPFQPNYLVKLGLLPQMGINDKLKPQGGVINIDYVDMWGGVYVKPPKGVYIEQKTYQNGYIERLKKMIWVE